MNYLASILLGLAVFSAHSFQGCSAKRNTIKVKYSLLPFNGYIDMPTTTKDRSIRKYVQVEKDVAQLDVPASLWCQPNDPRVCMMYDTNGNAVGIQISFLEADVAKAKEYDLSAVNTYTKTNIFGIPAHSLRVYFVDPAKLTEAGRPNMDEVVEGVWVNLKGKIESPALKDPKVDKDGVFVRQNCFPQMGQHYWYNISHETTDCSELVSFFSLYNKGELNGFGITNYGTPSVARRGTDWYETVPLLGVKLIMPDRPTCIDEMVTKYGLFSVHVYFSDYPYLITCPLF